MSEKSHPSCQKPFCLIAQVSHSYYTKGQTIKQSSLKRLGMTPSLLSWIEVSRSAFNHNIASYQSVIGADRKLTPVIKSNAYGHGLLEIGQLCQEHATVFGVCVSSLSEALLLRKNGFSKFILVLNSVDQDPTLAAQQDIDVAVFSAEQADEFSHTNHSSKALRIHLKVDTGLSRFGIPPSQALTAIETILRMNKLFFAGIYTHFAQAAKGDTQFTFEQYHLFNTMLDLLAQKNLLPELIHASNSAGTTLLEHERCTMFRVGAGTYGIWPSLANKEITVAKFPTFSLRPLATWKTRITYIKQIPAHAYIGYDRTFQAPRAMTLAMTSTGYFDGYDFRLSNKGIGYLHGNPIPVVGRVAMNVTIFDVTDVVCAEGDVITLVGDQPYITAVDIADRMGNLNVREFLVTLNPGIPRLITQ